MTLRERILIGLVVLVLVVVGALAIGVWRLVPSAPPSEEGYQATGDKPGEAPASAAFGQFSPVDPPRPAPALTFAARDGSSLSLADFRGRWLLVNLWATWCEPCVREMPSLDRLQAKLGDHIAVLAVSEDRGAAHAVDPFLEKLALKNLAIYLDPKSAVGQAFGTRGLPTSLLIDPGGRLVGKLEGAAEWDSAD
ncbi:MAG TPA: TlpA disulfide reductase family protein, partial [Stellaceae bacterium]|nr:TlpA disulfide reductase family protein [Stellaceae bacterium]